MEFVEGETLEHLIERFGRLEAKLALEIALWLQCKTGDLARPIAEKGRNQPSSTRRAWTPVLQCFCTSTPGSLLHDLICQILQRRRTEPKQFQ
jgi:hypothetical protein